MRVEGEREEGRKGGETGIEIKFLTCVILSKCTPKLCLNIMLQVKKCKRKNIILIIRSFSNKRKTGITENQKLDSKYNAQLIKM